MEKDKKFFGFGRNVFVAGLVSFFMDVSSEMIYPLVPLFLANTLGISKSLIGLIEGIAESTASLLKVFSGWFSDRIGNRKWLMAAGYGISTLSRPIVALATSKKGRGSGLVSCIHFFTCAVNSEILSSALISSLRSIRWSKNLAEIRSESRIHRLCRTYHITKLSRIFGRNLA